MSGCVGLARWTLGEWVCTVGLARWTLGEWVCSVGLARWTLGEWVCTVGLARTSWFKGLDELTQRTERVDVIARYFARFGGNLLTYGRRSLVSGTQNVIVISWITLWGMIKVYWLNGLTLAYILDHAVCCASAAISDRSFDSHKQSERLGGVVWVYKIGLKWPVIAMAITRKPQSLSIYLRETENWNSSSKTLFYKDCSLGAVKTPSNS